MARTLLVSLLALILAATPAGAAAFYFSPDVPTTLGGTTYLPWEIVRYEAGAYAPVQTLPVNTEIDALHRMDNGNWLLSVRAPTLLGGTTYRPEDVVRFDGVNYALFFDGAANGVPAGSNVDAIFLNGGDTGDLILSFEVPATIAGNTYDNNDLLRFAAGVFTLFLDASALPSPIPPSTNTTGADVRGGLTILTFAVPTTLGGATYLPGELVAWDGAVFTSFHQDPSWPPGSRLNAMAFLADPGTIGPTLRVDKSLIVAGDLRLSWSPSCSSGAEDYGVYEGVLGDWYSHTRIDCSDEDGDHAQEITPSVVDAYYLLVANNPNDEGSYGVDAAGAERPRGAATCVADQAITPCP